ncbi:MAG: HD domain-containing protein, partial [Desulfovibrio sp.]|nr:HD domain-containing protein [Desulfovibrio sp.]
PLQDRMLGNKDGEEIFIDIACEPDIATLAKLFPGITPVEGSAFATMTENGRSYRFYALSSSEPNHPELSLLRITPNLIAEMPDNMREQLRLSGLGEIRPSSDDPYAGFADIEKGSIRILGVPDETIRHNYLLPIRALRYAANFDIPIEPNTWMGIVRSSVRILDYVPMNDIIDEWRKVAAESMHRFVRLLYDSHILQGLIPEIAGLACVPQQNDRGEVENVFEHTLKTMKHYPEEGMHYDWLGTVAMMFHDVGKLFTADYFDGRWTFFQHHRVGARVTRKILRRLHFDMADTELICQLVDGHMRLNFMLTDRGIRRFKALGETRRLIAMARADVLAKDDSLTSFNHNMKYLDRAETPEEMLEPLLNGNEIMEVTGKSPGPLIGAMRDALLAAQKTGLVADRQGAIEFVRNYVPLE